MTLKTLTYEKTEEIKGEIGNRRILQPKRAKSASKQELHARIDKLSVREREVFVLLLEGHTLRQIADILNLKYSTINTHHTKLYKKLQVNSRPELIITYREVMMAQKR